MAKGRKLQAMGFIDILLRPHRKGECALCEHVLSQVTDSIFHCEDCRAVYYKLSNGNLDYVGKFHVEVSNR